MNKNEERKQHEESVEEEEFRDSPTRVPMSATEYGVEEPEKPKGLKAMTPILIPLIIAIVVAWAMMTLMGVPKGTHQADVTRLEGDLVDIRTTNIAINAELDDLPATYVSETDLTDYVTHTYFLGNIPVLTGYAKTEDLEGYVTVIALNDTLQDEVDGYATIKYVDEWDLWGLGLVGIWLEDYATKEYVDDAIDALGEIDCTGYATEAWVEDTLEEYVLEDDLPSYKYATEEYVDTSLEDYATEDWVNGEFVSWSVYEDSLQIIELDVNGSNISVDLLGEDGLSVVIRLTFILNSPYQITSGSSIDDAIKWIYDGHEAIKVDGDSLVYSLFHDGTDYYVSSMTWYSDDFNLNIDPVDPEGEWAYSEPENYGNHKVTAEVMLVD